MKRIHTGIEDVTTELAAEANLDRLIGELNPNVSQTDSVAPDSIDLPPYDVSVVDRRTFKPSESVDGGTVHHEIVRYSDKVVRRATIFEPDEPVSEHPILTGDFWLSGPDGLGRMRSQMWMRHGFTVVANHHQGREAGVPKSVRAAAQLFTRKSVGKSAYHDHALFDDLAKSLKANTNAIMLEGFSRRSMTNEAAAAIGPRLEVPRLTVWSDNEADCFTKGVGVAGLAKTLREQAIPEAETILQIYDDMRNKRPINEREDALTIDDIKGTLDMHPVNLLHEAAWIPLLINGDAGLYIQALPTDTRGIRTIFIKDGLSQPFENEAAYADLPNVQVLRRPYAHCAAFIASRLREKDRRFAKLAQYALEHDDDFGDITPQDVLGY